tara:strand:- start:5781 stop:6056 length:276 start_codon:yes stop_codon:yes gene_type:complete
MPSYYTVTLTDTEKKAFDYVALDVDHWIKNAATNRARIAKEEIVKLNTEYCNENGISIAVGIDAQVTQAYDLGVVKTAVQRNAEFQNSPPV